MNPKLLCPCLLGPVFIAAQEVRPVVSNDYLSLIRRDTAAQARFLPDTTNSMAASSLRFVGHYEGFAVKKIGQQRNNLVIEPASAKFLFVSGSFGSAVEVKTVNRLPSLQNRFAQGRSQNRTLAWQGPETSELSMYQRGLAQPTPLFQLRILLIFKYGNQVAT